MFYFQIISFFVVFISKLFKKNSAHQRKKVLFYRLFVFPHCSDRSIVNVSACGFNATLLIAEKCEWEKQLSVIHWIFIAFQMLYIFISYGNFQWAPCTRDLWREYKMIEDFVVPEIWQSVAVCLRVVNTDEEHIDYFDYAFMRLCNFVASFLLFVVVFLLYLLSLNQTYLRLFFRLCNKETTRDERRKKSQNIWKIRRCRSMMTYIRWKYFGVMNEN